ncbi:ZmpA/ZmpB/ZmpC family metallo-endopeptidase-related protein [Clostridium chauvoei]|uniref:M6 family metalloprotease domain-containing protein n=2 Tax=Clostridium chauvoei TaxID=46867 RepID=A0ABD4RG91_9CLOT|nr:ZmpA/ZmpB/ZmpC family metallo-endopeptidase-related protein [Clostridium chauvoei]MBX7289964.1 hypothetical protein [Clostridium chauvoei]
MDRNKYIKNFWSFFTVIIISINIFSQSIIYAQEIEYKVEGSMLGIDVYSAGMDKPTYQSTYNIPDEINNIVIFVRFKGEKEFVNDKSFSVINDIYNGNDISLKEYLSDLTYGRVKSNTTFYPVDKDNKHYSYEAPNSREYYKRKSSTNPIGYKDDGERFTRENELLSDAARSIVSQVNVDGDKLDFNKDGSIDNVTYVIKGLPEGHGDLLWPHKSTMSNTTYINGKSITEYNVLTQGTENTGVMGKYMRLVGVVVHEFLHTFFFPDLYRYSSNSSNPVGKWDIMAGTAKNPQLPLAYTRLTYDGTETVIPEITSDGEYRLSPSNSKIKGDTIAYKIKSPLSKNQYFVVEFRKGDDKWDSVLNINNPGLLAYRIDESVGIFEGNKMGYPDHIYVFRPGVTSPELADGNIDEAIISPSLGETKIGKASSRLNFDDETLYFQNGSNSGIEIYDIKFTNEGKLDFKVKFPKIDGDGSKEKPFIITTAEQFNNIRNNSNAYYKLAADIDMSEITNFSPIKEFKGVLDGDGHTIKNININRQAEECIGIFNIIYKGAVVKNLNFSNVNIVGNRLVGGVSENNNGIIENVKIRGKISADKDYIGGLTENNSGKIINSISTCDVIGGDYIGGIAANNYFGTIENTIFSGKLEITSGNKIGGIAARNYEKESVVKNSYWDITKSSVEVGAAEGDGALTKGMIGVKANKNIEVNEGEEVEASFKLVGDKSDITSIDGEFLIENKEIIDSINVLEIYDGKLNYKLKANKEGKTKFTYAIKVGRNILNVDTDVIVKSNFKKEDLNKDKIVDIEDLALISLKYNLTSKDKEWKSEYDLNLDGIIDIFDLVKVCKIIK